MLYLVLISHLFIFTWLAYCRNIQIENIKCNQDQPRTLPYLQGVGNTRSRRPPRCGSSGASRGSRTTPGSDMFNVLWRRTTVSAIPLQLARRHFAITTPFVPPESLNDVASASDASPPLGRPPARGRYDPALKPSSPTFYTGRAAYYDGLLELEDAANVTRQALKAMSLYPLPRFARDSLPPLQPMWRDKRNMGSVVGATLSTARYRRMVNVLNELNDFKRIAETAGVAELTGHLAELLGTYEKANKEAVLARGKRKPVEFDEYGRTYTVGRRKESSARVWVIPVQRPPAPTVEETKNTQVDDVAPFLPASFSEKPAASVPTVVTTTNIIINNAPLHEYLYVAQCSCKLLELIQCLSQPDTY